MTKSIVPRQVRGKENNLEVVKHLPTEGEARKVFARACKRISNPGIWHKLAGEEKAKFRLANSGGHLLRRLLREKDYIRINIPGPGPKAGDGYDWVQVDLVEDRRKKAASEESFGILLVSSPNPVGEDKKAAHFFTEDTTSTFHILRNGNSVIARYHGRNEQINNKTPKLGDNIRNTIVAIGAMLGLSELQWKSLLTGLLEEEVGES